MQRDEPSLRWVNRQPSIRNGRAAARSFLQRADGSSGRCRLGSICCAYRTGEEEEAASIITVRVLVLVLPQVSIPAYQLTRLVVVDDEEPRRKFRLRENPAAGRVQQYAPPTKPR